MPAQSASDRLHLLPYQVAAGQENMAIDEVLLQRAATGVSTLRFYGWSEPTLSLGYFQPSYVRNSDPLIAKLPYVRRASGGSALVHHHELTYALALSADVTKRRSSGWIARMHHIIADALRELGVTQPLLVYEGEQQIRHEVLCFAKITPGDLLCGDAKIAGSAQRKYRGALLQHGGILMATSEYTPMLPGLAECGVGDTDLTRLMEVLKNRFSGEIDLVLRDCPLKNSEQMIVTDLVVKKYANTIWANKR